MVLLGISNAPPFNLLVTVIILLLSAVGFLVVVFRVAYLIFTAIFRLFSHRYSSIKKDPALL